MERKTTSFIYPNGKQTINDNNMATPINDVNTLIERIDTKYPFSSDSTNYGQILRGVANKALIHDIIKDIVTTIDGLSKQPYSMTDCKKFLYGYMNECIANLYERRGETTMDCFCEAWINIRTHENKKATRERIEQIAKSRGLEIDKTIKDIHKTFHEFEHNYKMLKQFNYGTNGYNQYLPPSKNGAALLLKYRFDPYGLPYGLGFCSNIFTEVEREQRKTKEAETHDDYLNKRRAYWKQLKNEEEDEKEKRKLKVKDPNSLTALQVILMIIVGGLFGWLMAEAGNLIILFALFVGALFLKCLR